MRRNVPKISLANVNVSHNFLKWLEGAITIEFASVICEVLTQSGKIYKIRAFMKNCKQIEYNDRLTPELLVTKPETDGYLAIFMFKKVEEHETCTDLIKHIYQFNSNLNK